VLVRIDGANAPDAVEADPALPLPGAPLFPDRGLTF
jgi:hypothetical protein